MTAPEGGQTNQAQRIGSQARPVGTIFHIGFLHYFF